jgi:sortase (surface protein transpeptidase)
VAIVLAAVVLCEVLVLRLPRPDRDAGSEEVATTTTAPARAIGSTTTTLAPMPAPAAAAPVPPPEARPVTVRIPALDVEAPMVALGLDDDGALEAPADYRQAGWYALGPRPGEPGPAVVAAHVDSTTGPAPFYRLGAVGPGTDVVVDYDDGSSVSFTTTRTEQHPKEAFPTEEVYGPTDGAELRLITCGGAFDRERGHYRDNVVVWAIARSPG